MGKPLRLSIRRQSASKRRVAYSLAAGAAAGAVASDTRADIIYSGLKNLSITPGSAQTLLDLDSNGVGDFFVKNYVFSFGAVHYQAVSVRYSPGKLVGFSANGFNYVSALSPGSPINSSTMGSSFTGFLAYTTHATNSKFLNATDKYIGLSFPHGSSTYYGWMRVDVNNSTGLLTVKDWAYETQAGSIAAAVPEVSPLGLLAVGSTGLLLLRRWRNRKSIDVEGDAERLVTA